MEKFIMAGGCAIRISDRGKGENTIVMLHGYLESLDVWDYFTPLLTPQLRVIAIDLPGHGISEVKGTVHTMEFLADTVMSALGELGIEKCVLAGHSMGGYVALEFLRKYPQILSGLILFHATPNPDTDAKREQREREINIVESGKKELLAQTVANGFAADNRVRFADEIEDLREQVVLTDDKGIMALLRGMSLRKDSNEIMRESDIPQMIIFGRSDEYITCETTAEVIKRQPQARIVWLENSGHMGFVEEPEASAVAVMEFCAAVNDAQKQH